MKTKKIDKPLQIRTMANGIMVEPLRGHGEIYDDSTVFVFNDFKEFTDWLKKELME
tara:strand:+ start:771 stop:938 length:168 start_codon:yes stop_codon:yes gene_type:complete